MEVTNNLTKKGLDGFTLKIIALVLMTIDHSYEFFETNGIPIWFNWLGRLSAPLFLFTMAEGFFHTRNRITYVKRLYFFSVIMSLGKFISWKISISDPSYTVVKNNIFETLFLIGLNILLFEFLRDKNKEFNKKVLFISLAVFFEIILPIGVSSLFSKNVSQIIMSFLPCPLVCEGSFVFVILGIIFFYLRNKRKKMMIVYSIFSLVLFPFSNFTFETAFYHNYQWMMIFSVPLMLLYNGKKGNGLKYLFYIYYPAHILLFFFISGIIK